MRFTRYHLVLLGGLLLAIVGPVAFTQGPGGFGGRGGSRWDPAEMFKQYANGKDVITVAEVQSTSRRMTTEQLRERMNTFLQKKGITNGKMTLAQYQEYTDETRREFMEKFAKGGFKFGPGGAAPGSTPGATPTTPGAAPPNPADVDAQAKELFARLDTDKDGSLSLTEMETARRSGLSSIYDARDRWDANKNGSIDLAEFTAYYKDSIARRGSWNGQPAPEAPPEEDKRPVVYRVGKLPPELKTVAPWFEALDKDKDGQVGLYEWKSAGREIKEFLAMDANADGFVTVEELLRHYKVTTKKDDKKGTTGTSTAVAAFPVPGATPGAVMTPGGRGRQRGGDPRGGGGRNRFRGSWGGASGR